MKYYLLGDSHATEMYGFFEEKKIFNVEWHTLLGYGFQSFAGNSTLRRLPETAKKSIISLLKSLERGSTLIFSYTETDSRVAMGSEGHKTIYQDYKVALEEMLLLTEAKKLLF